MGRADGFERDGFVMNSDDDDEEAKDDQAMMANMERAKRRQHELKDEYPSDLTFGGRQRGDAEDAPILVRLPKLHSMHSGHPRLCALTKKKARVVVSEEAMEHDAVRDNDLDALVAYENRDNVDVREERERKAKKEKKKAKKEKKKAKKEKAKSADEAEEEDGDVEMGDAK